MQATLAAAARLALTTAIAAAPAACTYTRGETAKQIGPVGLAGTSNDAAGPDGPRIVDLPQDLRIILTTREQMTEFGDPQPGDRLTIEHNGDTYSLEVRTIPGEICWRWTDRFNTGRRIYCQTS